MKNWRKENVTTLTCWMVFLALLFSFVFSGAGLDLGRHFSRGRTGAGRDMALCARNVSAVVDWAETEILEENEEEEEFREELCRPFSPRGARDVPNPGAFYHKSSFITVVHRSPVSCPLLI